MTAQQNADYIDKIHHSDAIRLCDRLEPQSVDMLLADLPYGTTACEWDTVIPFDLMWTAFKRAIKPRGAIVLTASQPFTSDLIVSNRKMFKYSWVWVKSQGKNFINAPYQPLKAHEDIVVFSSAAASWKSGGSMCYYPQKTAGKPYSQSRSKDGLYNMHSSPSIDPKTENNTGDRYPTSILQFMEERGLHPTQKPVALFEYLIRTYTQPGEVVLDPVVGSGTTAIAARNTDRRFICGDSSAEFVQVARDRLANTDGFLSRGVAPGVVQKSLFESNSSE